MTLGSPSGLDPRRIRWAAAGGVVVVLTVWIAVAAANREDPVDVVEDFFAAVVHRDVDRALALVDRSGGGVPIGPEAAFLDPRAIAGGWDLVSATEQHRDDDGQWATVTVTLAGPDGTAEGDLLVARDYDGPWRMYSPLVLVEFPASPLSFVRVNDLSVPAAARPGSPARFWLFPGGYRFYPDLPGVVSGPDAEPVMAFPAYENRSDYPGTQPYTVAAGALSATEQAVSAATEQIAALVDDCVEFTTPVPYHCPFATDGEIDTTDGRRIREPEDLQWRVSRYPVVSLADNRAEQQPVGFQVVTETAGIVTLTGSGVDSDGDVVTFTVECGIELTGLTVTIGAGGEVGLATNGAFADDQRNTCHRNP
jgi:hypothetical protein